MSIRLSACFAFVAAFFGLALTATTPAHAYVEAGSLSCRSQGPAGFVVVSSRVFDCVFAPASGAPPQYYRGTVSRFGAQIGFTNDVALGWIVLAATSRLGPGALAGGYLAFRVERRSASASARTVLSVDSTTRSLSNR